MPFYDCFLSQNLALLSLLHVCSLKRRIPTTIHPLLFACGVEDGSCMAASLSLNHLVKATCMLLETIQQVILRICLFCSRHGLGDEFLSAYAVQRLSVSCLICICD